MGKQLVCSHLAWLPAGIFLPIRPFLKRYIRVRIHYSYCVSGDRDVILSLGNRSFMKNILILTAMGLLFATASSTATEFTSVADGDWATVTSWTPNGNPDTGDFTTDGEGIDSVIIDGFSITVNGDTYGGADADPANDRFTIANNNSVTIRGGGSLTFSDAGGQHTWLARYSDGTISIESGSLISSGGQDIRIASGATAVRGDLVVGDGIGASGDATVDMGGALIYSGYFGGTGSQPGVVTINSDGRVEDTRFTIGHQGQGTLVMNDGYLQSAAGNLHYVGQSNNGRGNMVMNGNSVFDLRTTSGDGRFRIGSDNNSQGTLTLNDNSVINIAANVDDFHIGRDGNSHGTVTLNNNAQIIGLNNDAISDTGIVVGRGGDSATLNINDNALINIRAPISLSGSGSVNTDVNVVNHNSGTVITDKDIFVGRNADANYILTVGSVTARDIRLGFEGGTGTFTQNGGTVQLTGRDILVSEHPTLTSGNGVYNLLGGTLQVDNINLDAGADNPVDGVFNWGGGTLTASFPNNKNNPGGTDYTTTDPINGIGQIVRSGTTISVTGDMATGFGGGTSHLNLGNTYPDDGTRIDIMQISGTLDLTGADTLTAVGSPNLLRPIGGGAIDYGSIPLVTATGGITGGSFDSFTPLQADGRPFYASPFPVSDPANLKPNTYYVETTGDTVYFHYKVTGTVPEPGTGVLFGIGVLMLRGLHRMRRTTSTAA
jgi:hypothetical protein